jgi:chitinase
MKYTYKLFLALIIPLLIVSCTARRLTSSNTASNQKAHKAPASFRVVGYVIYYDLAKGKLNHFDISRLNYLNVFYNKADTNGKFADLTNLDSIITAAHKNNVKVMATIGNATSLSLITDTARGKFIDTLVSSLVALKMDGIDVDFEGDHINKDYEGFVGALSAALKAKGKLMTAAVATWETQWLSDKALSYYDFLNIMTYDATGPWNLKEPGPHSPYSFAVSDLNFWTNTRHIAKDKLNLGLPFYGYGFGPGVKREYHYWQIVQQYPGAENTDSVNVAPGANIYYNGIPAMKKKTKLAMKNAGGVMLWELMEDADGDKSLLSAVDKTANPRNK